MGDAGQQAQLTEVEQVLASQCLNVRHFNAEGVAQTLPALESDRINLPFANQRAEVEAPGQILDVDAQSARCQRESARLRPRLGVVDRCRRIDRLARQSLPGQVFPGQGQVPEPHCIELLAGTADQQLMTTQHAGHQQHGQRHDQQH
ncbi:hypothetical protein D9M71_718910 [compost metagenome]